MDKRVKAEVERLTALLENAEISASRVEMLEPVIENSACMKVKLDEIMEQISEADIIVEYDNGGGQRGIRENPIFKGYEALWKSYMSGMSVILSALPAEVVKTESERVVESKTMLELVRDKHNRKEA